MNPHQKKFVSQTEAVFSFLNDRGIQIPCEQELSEKEDREMAFKKKAYHNTELLLKNYRNILWQLDCEVDTIAAELDVPFKDIDALLSRVDAAIGMDDRRIERRVERLSKTRKLLDRVNEALTVLKEKPGNGDLLYQIISLSYISRSEMRQCEIIDQLNISKRHFYRLREEAVNIISLRLWNAPTEQLGLWLELIDVLSQNCE